MGIRQPEGGAQGWLAGATASATVEEEWRLTEQLFSAHQEAARWGAERFAAEFRSRSEEERRLREAEARTFGSPAETDAATAAPSTAGPVLWEVAERVVGRDPGHLELHRPMRHAHVPRPPAPEPGPRRDRRRKRGREEPEPASAISEQEAARMSPAARRLYGLPELPQLPQLPELPQRRGR